MDIRNCRSCGRPYIFVGRSLCADCLAKEEERFEKVRVFLRDNPGSTIEDTERATGVSREEILRFCREGRIQLGSGTHLLNCIKCGKSIEKGYYCADCARGLLAEIQEFEDNSSEKEDSSSRAKKSTNQIYVLRHLQKQD